MSQPQSRTSSRPTDRRPVPATPDRPSPPPVQRPSGITVNQVLAGAGASATSAVFGSFFGATGTVTGAALGSVVTTVGATVYQRSLERTATTVKAKVKVVGPNRTRTVERRVASGAPGEATVPLQRVSSDEPETVLLGPVDTPRRRRLRPAVVVGATVLIFVLGLLAVTGVEWVKGSSLAGGEQGTSVGRVLDAGPAPAAPADAPVDPEQGSEPDGSTAPTDESGDAGSVPTDETDDPEVGTGDDAGTGDAPSGDDATDGSTGESGGSDQGDQGGPDQGSSGGPDGQGSGAADQGGG